MPRASVLAIAVAVAAAVSAFACGDSPDDGLGRSSRAPGEGGQEVDPNAPKVNYEDPHVTAVEKLPNPLEGLPTHGDSINKICSRGVNNAVTNSFCKGKTVSSIVELQDAVGLGFKDRSANGLNGANGNPAFAILGHSSSLVARSVSAINPRVFVFSPPPGKPVRIPGYTVTGFTRGDNFVEIATEDPNTQKLTFYLVKFDLACEATDSCKPGDILTPAAEKGWTGFSIYDDEDLKNTLVDCRHCHQPGGPNTKPMLRMQEIKDPWTHWFKNDTAGGVALFKDFLRAHGDKEDYGGVPATFMQDADGRAMEDFIEGQGFALQPNSFDTKTIENEVIASASSQPDLNSPPGTSSTWQGLYDAAFRGEFIPPPYHDVKVTDPAKLQFASDSYRNMVEGNLPRSELPDIRRVFLDSALEGMTMRTKKGATGRQVLVQACAQCHNPNLDQSISRAHFDVTRIDSMSASEKAAVIHRLRLVESDRGHMPPAMIRSLDDDAMAAAIAELSK